MARSWSSTSSGSRSGSTSRSCSGRSSPGDGDVLWGLLWREGPAEWLKFVAPITILVFAQSGLYRQRELRPGAGRILACLIVVALIVLAFGLGTGYDFTTSGLIPTSVVVSAITIGLLRAAYESASLEIMRAAGIRRRVVLVGAGESLARLRSSLVERAERAQLRVRRRGRARTSVPGFRLLGSRAELPLVLDQVAPRRGHPHRGGLRRAHRARGRRAGAPPGDQGAARPRHDRAARPARRVRARPGSAAVRAAAAGAHGLGLGREARLRPRRERARRRHRPAALAADRGWRSRSTRAGPSSSSTAGSASASASSGC